MKTYKKNYIGKGMPIPNMSITKVTVKVSELLKFAHNFEGEQYCTFEVAKMQRPDKFGREYTVYCTTIEESSSGKAESSSEKSKA